MSILDKINIFDRMEQTKDLQRQQDQAMSDQFGVTPTQASYLAAQFAPGMGIQDAAGEMPGFPPADAGMVDIFSAPNEPSMAENIRSGGLDRYLIAPLQGLGVVGDAVTAVPLAGPLVGGALKLPGALAAVAGGIGKAKKGIISLDKVYHGSPNTNLEKVTIAKSKQSENFMPHISVTDDPLLAQSFTKGELGNLPEGNIYQATGNFKIIDYTTDEGKNIWTSLGKNDYERAINAKEAGFDGRQINNYEELKVDSFYPEIDYNTIKNSHEIQMFKDIDVFPMQSSKLGSNKAKKGITALDDTKKMLKADVDAFARDDTGFVSPTLKALIERAPANLKGKQITDWLNANANKGVKPKELEYLGFDDYLAANPTATVREAVQGVSGNKVKVTRTSADDAGDSGPLLEFDVQVSRSDPLDGSSPWDNDIENIKYDIENGDSAALQSYADTYAAGRLTPDEMRTYGNKFTFADMQNRINRGLESGASNETLDDVIEEFAEDMYMDNPYQMIQPMTEFEPGNYDKLPAFAYGNDDVGYQLFVNGERKTNPNNVPYSQTEAQIQLRNVMEEDGIGPGRFGIQGEDDFYFDNEMAPRNYQDYVDESLPGGKNYRQVLFRWENAPKGHNSLDHFDDPQAIAHALVRDRKLADGTDSLHVDELQSDVHRDGAKNGYQMSDVEVKKIIDEVEDILPDGFSVDSEFVYPEFGDPISINEIGFAFERLNETSNSDYLQLLRPAVKDFVVNNNKEFKKIAKISKPITKITDDAVPNYPFKDDWHNMGLQQLVLDAIENGKDTISVSGSLPMISRYSNRYATFYETLYDKKIPSAMKKLANKYGGKFETGKLDEIDIHGSKIEDARAGDNIAIDELLTTYGESLDNGSGIGDVLENLDYLHDANILRITPEMKAKVLEEGFPGFALGGEVSTKGIKALGLKGIVMPKEVDLGIGSIR